MFSYKGFYIHYMNIDFYFFALRNNAKSHPTNDHPNNQEPNLTRARFSFDAPFAAAKYAGVKTMHTNIVMATMYFSINKIFIPNNILYSVFCL